MVKNSNFLFSSFRFRNLKMTFFRFFHHGDRLRYFSPYWKTSCNQAAGMSQMCRLLFSQLPSKTSSPDWVSISPQSEPISPLLGSPVRDSSTWQFSRFEVLNNVLSLCFENRLINLSSFSVNYINIKIVLCSYRQQFTFANLHATMTNPLCFRAQFRWPRPSRLNVG